MPSVTPLTCPRRTALSRCRRRAATRFRWIILRGRRCSRWPPPRRCSHARCRQTWAPRRVGTCVDSVRNTSRPAAARRPPLCASRRRLPECAEPSRFQRRSWQPSTARTRRGGTRTRRRRRRARARPRSASCAPPSTNSRRARENQSRRRKYDEFAAPRRAVTAAPLRQAAHTAATPGRACGHARAVHVRRAPGSISGA